MYFILNDLCKINPIYQFSLKVMYSDEMICNVTVFSFSKAFNVVFHKAIERAEPSDDVKIRVNQLIDSITYSVFMYTTRGLFERDKIIFTAQVTFQVSDNFTVLSERCTTCIYSCTCTLCIYNVHIQIHCIYTYIYIHNVYTDSNLNKVSHTCN